MSTAIVSTPLSTQTRRILLYGWLATVVLGFGGLHALLGQERERERQNVEIRLGLVASAHSKVASDWVNDHVAALHNLASNVSLKLYLTELSYSQTPDSDIKPEPAELTYLRNLLIASAELGGFASPLSEMDTLGISTPPAYGAGLALVKLGAGQVAATRAMPPHQMLPPLITEDVDRLQETVISPVFQLTPGKPAIAFRVPITAVQADSDAFPLGFVVGVVLLDDAFYAKLSSIADNETTANSLLIELQKDGTEERLLYLSPPQDEKDQYVRSIEHDSPLAAPAAIRTPNKMIEAQDYLGTQVFAIAHPVPHMPWYVVRKIEASSAMQPYSRRAALFYLAYVLGTALISAIVTALWRHASAQRAKHLAQHYQSLSHRLQKQEALLELIAQTTPIATYIVDEKGILRYANERAAQDMATPRATLPGRALSAILPQAQVNRILAANAQALTALTPQEDIWREEAKGKLLQARRVQHIPLEAIPLPDAAQESPLRGVLVIDQDITGILRQEERRASLLRQLIATLVEMVDRRDPHAARHSSCVALLAREVGQQMRLEETMIATAHIAGQLMNVGKITVPEALLTKKEVLEDREKDHIRASILASVDVLAGIEFDGPVVETLRQSLTHNPQLVSAQIIAAANDFVAMISPRAWRDGLPMEQAIAQMLSQADARYARPVVVALVHYLENAGGKHAVREHIGGIA